MDTTPTTELEAVNQMMRAIGEAPVSSLVGSGDIDVSNAKATLEEVTRAVLTEGWQFNTEYDYPFPVDNAGEIPLPTNALAVDVNRRAVNGIDPVVRGQKLYDRKNHTYKFNTTVRAKVVFGLGYSELPEAARYYIAYRACRKFQDTSVGSDTLHRYTANDEIRARVVFMDQHSDDEDLNMIHSTPDFAHVR